MPTIDWSEHVDLYTRGKPGPDGEPTAVRIATGPFKEIVGHVYLLPLASRGSLWVESDTVGHLSIFEILVLSMREDFPPP